MKAECRVLANNDIAYLWWCVPEKIDGALGFSVHRELKNGSTRALPAWVGFKKVTSSAEVRNTDVWPIQSFQWKDVGAPRKGTFRYRIYVVKGTAEKPKREENPIFVTRWVYLREQFGPVRAVFNRGLLSTQALKRGSNAPAKNANKLRAAISTPGDTVRWRLSKELLPTLYDLLRRARKGGGSCSAALYELTDEELIAELMKTTGARIVLSNANSSITVNKKAKTVYDGTNQAARERLRGALFDITDRMLTGNHIGHNKFIVYSDATGPAAVLTGSTNWTPTGLCGQTNNALLIENREVATHYEEYWKRLRAEIKPLQKPALRTWARTKPLEVALGAAGKMKVWFSPNTTRLNTSKAEDPADMLEVFDIIDKARSIVLFLLFNPGSPSIIERIREREKAAADAGKMLYVRGAISDAKTAREGAVRVYSRSAKVGNRVITGVAGVPDDFGYWEKELLKLGHAAIHDKVLVVDPFSKNCAVVTGSHNLGYKASFSNDENMVIIRGNKPIAEAYATHVLDVVNHYKWRYVLQYLHAKGELHKAWQDLREDDKWQYKYFHEGYLASHDAFVLNAAGSG